MTKLENQVYCNHTEVRPQKNAEGDVVYQVRLKIDQQSFNVNDPQDTRPEAHWTAQQLARALARFKAKKRKTAGRSRQAYIQGLQAAHRLIQLRQENAQALKFHPAHLAACQELALMIAAEVERWKKVKP